MSYPLRDFVPGQLLELTFKTQQDRFFFVPSAWLNLVIIGIFARAQRLSGLDVCILIVFSNHIHLLVIPDSVEQVARFCQFARSNLSKKIGGPNGWFGGIFAGRYKHVQVTAERAAEEERLEYILSHGVKEGLVRKPQHWPGVQCVEALATGKDQLEGIWVNETEMNRARDQGKNPDPADYQEVEVLKLTPIPSWAHLPAKERRGGIRRILKRIARRYQDKIQAVRPGAKARICGQLFGYRPQHTERTPRPRVHAASRSARAAEISRQQAFRELFQAASTAWLNGDPSALFNFPRESFIPWIPASRMPVLQARPG